VFPHRRLTRATLASLSVLALALVGTVPASAFSLAIDSTILAGSGPTTWNMASSQSTCSSGTGDTPVSDGAWQDRSDAFDEGLMITINGTGYADQDGYADVTNNTANTWGGLYSGLTVSEQITALPSSPTERVLVKFQNGSNKNHAPDVEFDSNVGSDSGTVLVGTSSGDKNNTLADRWIVSSDGTPTGDPVVTHVLYGKGASVKPTNLSSKISTGIDCETLHYTVKVPAGKTRYLLFFAQMHGTNKSAMSGAAPFNKLSSGSQLLSGISKGVQAQIVNWNL
jgi:hypothetical protein